MELEFKPSVMGMQLDWVASEGIIEEVPES